MYLVQQGKCIARQLILLCGAHAAHILPLHVTNLVIGHSPGKGLRPE